MPARWENARGVHLFSTRTAMSVPVMKQMRFEVCDARRERGGQVHRTRHLLRFAQRFRIIHKLPNANSVCHFLHCVFFRRVAFRHQHVTVGQRGCARPPEDSVTAKPVGPVAGGWRGALERERCSIGINVYFGAGMVGDAQKPVSIEPGDPIAQEASRKSLKLRDDLTAARGFPATSVVDDAREGRARDRPAPPGIRFA
ncbi:hypothetical protein SBC2_77470 (plasmid) [Caballeronia sp. SBC2]|nr:hypothetical protein SBC2_77470 [Caballeronia sp. SBC2]